MVNANLSEFERLNDTNHQYTKKNKDYCVKCGHYTSPNWEDRVACECSCHVKE